MPFILMWAQRQTQTYLAGDVLGLAHKIKRLFALETGICKVISAYSVLAADAGPETGAEPERTITASAGRLNHPSASFCFTK
ncbi:hypothetical protein SAMN04488040_3445 [Sulfitobacter marinus]|uniref:Uncharacterized protein n=1 Tax=Sulfitobacter marinus TaxID=394264 RepID=A0A1I6VLN7_9RHOB|nr:hypothetical protein SAMN04488040_3445 [Sulfitobacter marinus]